MRLAENVGRGEGLATSIVAAAAVGFTAAAVLAWWLVKHRYHRLSRLPAHRSRRALVNEQQIHFRSWLDSHGRSKPPVVLLHGFGISSSYFVPLAEQLADEFTVYAPDLPGHGKSETPLRPLDVPQLADALVGWMDALGLQRVSLVGNSMGCQIGVDAAARYGDRFVRLVLIGPTVDPSARSVSQQAWRLVIGSFYERPALAWLLLKDYMRMGDRLVAELRFMLQDRIEDKLPKVQIPVLLMRGQNDAVVAQDWLERIAQKVPTSRTTIIPDGGHAVHYSAVRPVASVIAPFLREASLSGETSHKPPERLMDTGGAAK